MDGRLLVPSSHVKACDFLGFVEYFFSEALHDNLPVTLYGPSKKVRRSMKKTALCKKATEFPWLELLADWAEKYFSA